MKGSTVKENMSTMPSSSIDRARKRKDLTARYFASESSEKRPLSTTIHKKSPHEIYSLLSNLDNFPRFFENLQKVESSGADQAKWYFKSTTEADAELVVPMKRVSQTQDEGFVWKAEDGAGFAYSVTVQLEPTQAQRGTVVRMVVAYENMAGKIAGIVEKLFGTDAEVQSKKNLQRLKAFCETGHFPTIEGQSSGRSEDLLSSTKH